MASMNPPSHHVEVAIRHSEMQGSTGPIVLSDLQTRVCRGECLGVISDQSRKTELCTESLA